MDVKVSEKIEDGDIIKLEAEVISTNGCFIYAKNLHGNGGHHTFHHNDVVLVQRKPKSVKLTRQQIIDADKNSSNMEEFLKNLGFLEETT